VWGVPIYAFQAGQPLSFQGFGADGIALSADGEDLYFGGVGKRYLYSIPTAALRANGPFSEALAQASVVSRGQKGVSDGYETDTNGYIYHGNAEQNAISFYNPANGTDALFVRDPRLNWVDTVSSGASVEREELLTSRQMSTGTDGYLYFTNNQLAFGPLVWPGTDRRQRPFALFRVKLPGNGTKPLLC
jgi:sugar lactone lactonase YvrE